MIGCRACICWRKSRNKKNSRKEVSDGIAGAESPAQALEGYRIECDVEKSPKRGENEDLFVRIGDVQQRLYPQNGDFGIETCSKISPKKGEVIMRIEGSLYLRGFERYDKGEDGLVFLRYREEKNGERKVEFRPAPSCYCDRGMYGYLLMLPKPQEEKKIDAGAVVMRTSKSRYTVIAFDNDRMEMFKFENIYDVRRGLNEFFHI